MDFIYCNKLNIRLPCKFYAEKKWKNENDGFLKFLKAASSLYSENNVLNPQDFALNVFESDSIGTSSEEMVKEVGVSKR